VNERTREQKLESSRARMAELAVRFLERTDADIMAMREALARLGAGDAGGIGEIRHLAHRMVGTGATLGFATLSACARVIEQLAEDCPSGIVPDGNSRARLENAVAALAAEHSQQAARPGSTF
jgi:HPt (histidine-containing phosphotransfer) domain-containing protein